MTTDYSYLYNQFFLVFVHPKITCQLAMTNDWELLIEGSKWAQFFRKHVKINLVYWKIAAGHRPTSIFRSKKIAAGGVKLSHPIRNRVKKHLSIYPFLIPFKERVIGDRWSSKIVVSQKSCSVFFQLFLFWWKSLNNIH